jgi:hypothetical protein
MKDIAASIRARLLNLARKEQVPFQRILTLYKQEGLLHRIVSVIPPLLIATIRRG